MACHRSRVLALGVLSAALASPAWAGGPPPRTADDDVRLLAARIDELIDVGLARARVRPAPPADDATFLRRLSLDLVGKTPPVADVRRFLADESQQKRDAAIKRLLDTPGYSQHFTNIWRDLLVPEASADFNKRYYVTPTMERWLRARFKENTPYDKMVHELITLPLGNNRDGMMRYYDPYSNTGPVTPMGFYVAKEGKPEDLAASAARLFLGVRLECAQCHDHPFGKWTREEFWSQAAFFAGVRRPRQGIIYDGSQLSESGDRRELTIPNTERVAQARFLDGKEPRWKYKVSARTALADWMTAPDNQFFSRAAVNRMWAHLFGVGIVDPVDDFSDANVASHPELLDLLAHEFVGHKFDFKFLIRAIALSKTYQRSSAGGSAADSLRLFARMPIKGLSPEQLFDSLSEATGYRDRTPYQQRFFSFGTPRQEFMEKFASQDKVTEYHTSIPQALTLMNNRLIADATHPSRSLVLAAIAESPFMTTSGRVEALFLAALSRKPTPDEAARYARYVEGGGTESNPKKALGDVFWVLLNSPEFKFNH
jgi:hypothetical protein